MRNICLTIIKGTREINLIQSKPRVYQIQDNQSDELKNVYFINYDKAKELFYTIIKDNEEKQDDVKAQV